MKEKIRIALVTIALGATALNIFGCSKEASYKYVYKVSYISPKVNTIMTSFYTYNKFQNHHNSQWIQNDYTSKNIDKLVTWQYDSLWVDSLGFISWGFEE